jgi:hypothetical protein
VLRPAKLRLLLGFPARSRFFARFVRGRGSQVLYLTLDPFPLFSPPPLLPWPAGGARREAATSKQPIYLNNPSLTRPAGTVTMEEERQPRQAQALLKKNPKQRQWLVLLRD